MLSVVHGAYMYECVNLCIKCASTYILSYSFLGDSEMYQPCLYYMRLNMVHVNLSESHYHWNVQVLFTLWSQWLINVITCLTLTLLSCSSSGMRPYQWMQRRWENTLWSLRTRPWGKGSSACFKAAAANLCESQSTQTTSRFLLLCLLQVSKCSFLFSFHS